MKSITLPYMHSFHDENDPKALDYIKNWELCNAALNEGKLYCRWNDGDRAGSIAKLKRNPDYRQAEDAPVIRSRTYRNHFTRAVEYQLDGGNFYVIATWKGRSNKVKVSIPYNKVELLIGDDIETVYCMYDHKSENEKLLENPNQKDIDGNVLAIGDRVLYINARYGSRMELERGTIKEFKVANEYRGKIFTTIILSDDGQTLSTLKHPDVMVCKIKE